MCWRERIGSIDSREPWERARKTMDRKIFFVVLLLALAVTILAGAQQTNKVYRIGVLTIGEARASRIQAFRQSMKELGYSEGKDFVLEIRRADEKRDQHPKL